MLSGFTVRSLAASNGICQEVLKQWWIDSIAIEERSSEVLNLQVRLAALDSDNW
jgi:hypothetical protein